MADKYNEETDAFELVRIYDLYFLFWKEIYSSQYTFSHGRGTGLRAVETISFV